MISMRFKPQPHRSPLIGVSDEQWTALVRALDVQPQNAVSESGGLGSYDIRPRRLVELGIATDLTPFRVAGAEGGELVEAEPGKGRQIYVCAFNSMTKVLGAPLSYKRFFSSPRLQLWILGESMRVYHEQKIARPNGVSAAGALAILHVGGRGALKSWPNLFTETRARYDAAEGAF